MDVQTLKRALAIVALVLAVASFVGTGPTLLAVAIVILCVAVLL